MRRVGAATALGVGALVLVGVILSFFWLPQVQQPATDWLGAMCSALGMPREWSRGEFGDAPIARASPVRLTHQLVGSSDPGDIGQGATLALRCTMCHGPTGISYADSPNLAGQYAAVIYKQLRDYQSGVRSSAIMSAMARKLSDREMRQLAFYYASLPKPRGSKLAGQIPAIVRWGDPMRNVAPCGSCHGDIDHTMTSPWLKGAPKEYLRSQLVAFAKGERRNDINEQMRAMARGLTPAEIDAAATYYAGDENAL